MTQSSKPLQLLRHAPQCRRSVSVSTHVFWHIERPALQDVTHCPLTQSTEPPLGAEQALPQVPQLLTSVDSALHCPEQFVYPLEH